MPKAIPRPERRDEPKVSETPCPLRGIDGFLLRHELIVIVLLCVLASVRVLVFSMAFPPFGNIDESVHYSLVCDYAEGHVPTGLEPYNTTASHVIAGHASSEYLSSLEAFNTSHLRYRLDQLPPRMADTIFNRRVFTHITRMNSESTQPPVYYAAAAGWYKLGGALGFEDVRLAYWLRFMNVLIYGLLVWIAYRFIRTLYPENPLLRVGVPLMLAFMPQDVLYCINNDVLTPLLFTIGFYSLLRIYPGGGKSWGLYLTTGLSVAAVFLVKFTNITIFLPMAFVTFMALRDARRDGNLRATLSRVALMLSAAVVPVALWLARNYYVVGDLGATRAKMHHLGWIYKPLAEVFHHPIFTPAGAYTFIRELIPSFWRGELVWHLDRIATPAADIFYVVSTLLFVGAAVVALLRKRERKPADERYVEWMGVSVLAASVAVMVVLSIIFDFGGCFYPSTKHPYFTSGRLMIGVTVPFFALYITGLDFLMARARLKFSRLGILMLIAVLITVSEVFLSLKAFHSPWNWFHL